MTSAAHAAHYENTIQSLQWDDLRSLWHQIEARNTQAGIQGRRLNTFRLY